MTKAILIAALAAAAVPATAEAQSFGKILNGLSKTLNTISAPVRRPDATTGATTNAAGHRISPAPAFGSVARADVAGVRLGMSPDAVRAALTAAGYRIDAPVKGYTFAQLAVRGAAARNPSLRAPWSEEGVREINAADANGQSIAVRFTAMPTGPVASHVRLNIDERRITRASFAEAVRAKYGPHTDADEGMLWYYWCDAGTVDCAQRSIGGDFAFVHYIAGPGSAWLELSDENVVGKRQAALLATEVDRLAPMQRARL